MRQGRGERIAGSPEALILMGDWRVPARHEGHTDENRGAYQRQNGGIGINERFFQKERIDGSVLHLTRRGLMGVPFSAQILLEPLWCSE